jgi:hypothetical protein
MISSREGRKSRLPKLFSILFGSSLAALAMAAMGGSAAEADCYICRQSGNSSYCANPPTGSSGSSGCKVVWSPSHPQVNQCVVFGNECS